MACARAATDLNRYAPDNCTWWVFQNAPWVPLGWGNAAEWYPNAQQCGFTTSQTPIEGSIAVWGPGVSSAGYGHVALVTTVKGNGDFVVTEMNWQGLGMVDTRTVPADAPNIQGFIYPPGADLSDAQAQNAQRRSQSQATAASRSSNPAADKPCGSLDIACALNKLSTQFVSAGLVAGGGLIVIVGLVVAAAVMLNKPARQALSSIGPLKALG